MLTFCLLWYGAVSLIMMTWWTALTFVFWWVLPLKLILDLLFCVLLADVLWLDWVEWYWYFYFLTCLVDDVPLLSIFCSDSPLMTMLPDVSLEWFLDVDDRYLLLECLWLDVCIECEFDWHVILLIAWIIFRVASVMRSVLSFLRCCLDFCVNCVVELIFDLTLIKWFVKW